MDKQEITEESNNEIHMDVEEDNKEQAEPSEGKNIMKSDEPHRQSLELESYLKEELNALPEDKFNFGIIFKISEKYRKLKEESYTPRVVSIGPLHHGKSHLQGMEVYKLRCLNKLKDKLRIGLKELSEFATRHEHLVRGCYQHFNYDTKEFSKMILLDGIFIILVIAKDTQLFGIVADTLLIDQNIWLASDIMHDLLLLENQLPLFFVQGLLEILNLQCNFYESLRKYFQEVGITNRLKNVECNDACHIVDFLLRLHLPSKRARSPVMSSESVTINASGLEEAARNADELRGGVRCFPVPNFAQLLTHRTASNKEPVTLTEQVTSLNARSEYTKSTSKQVTSTERVTSTQEARSPESTRNTSELHEAGVSSCLVALRQLLGLHRLSNKEQATSTEQVTSLNARSEYTKSCSELHKAGVRFSASSSGLFDVSFAEDTGALNIPQLKVSDTTEIFFRNLIAFEQCQHNNKFITSYIIFMDSLIDTVEDVELLVKHNIITNSLGENQLVADLFNNLHKEIIEDGKEFYFTETCNDLNKYSKDCIHQWRSSCFKWQLILKNKYFSNPWSVISFIAATVVVVLTIVQTVCATSGLNK